MGQQPALRVPDQFLAGQPAHALDEAAFDLADVERRVDAAPDVVQDVDRQHPALAGQQVDGDLGAGGAIGEIVERTPGQRARVVVDLGRAVVAVAPELDAGRIGGGHDFLPGTADLGAHDLGLLETHLGGAAAVLLGDEAGQSLAHLDRGELRGAAVEVGAGRGGGGRGIGHPGRVARTHAHARQRQAQRLGDDLRDLGVQALAHLGAAVVQQHAAIGVDMDQRTGLVELGRGEADAELDWRQRQSALDDRVGGVPVRDRGPPFAVARALGQPVDQRRQDVVLQRHAVVRDVALLGAVEVEPPHLERVLPEPARDLAHDRLDHEHALRSAEAAKGGAALLVGAAAPAVDRDMLEEIGVVAVKDCAVADRD